MRMILSLLFIITSSHSLLAVEGKGESNRKIAQEVSVLIDDIVYKLEPQDNGYRVLFRTHSAVYYLKNQSDFYEQVLSSLTASKNLQKKVRVQVDVDTMEIKEITVSLK